MIKFPEDLHNMNEYPGMVHWFSPKVLLNVVKKVIASKLFGQYADRRLVHASLNPIRDYQTDSRAEAGIGNAKDAVWVDYVADLGDGFDSTYTIAYLIGQRDLDVEGHKLPRADALVMGGDQVYPDASRDDYWRRMQRPYEAAFPRSSSPDAARPPVYLIPGNHDWYDGLTLFLAKFCRGRDTHLGSWNAGQGRSYFAFHLKENWWIWGYDSQLGEDIDQPQADYFTKVAETMNQGAKVIICASVPSWLKAEQGAESSAEREMFYRGLDFIGGILRDKCEDARVPLVLAGDLHHYSRYVAEPARTQFITAGGGGAFLHPTHNLPTKIRASWVKTSQALEVARLQKEIEENSEALYPSRSESRKLALGNIGFVFKNPDFCLTLGIFYWISALLILAWRGYGFQHDGPLLRVFIDQITSFLPTPAFLIVAAAFFTAIVHYADVPRKAWRVAIGSIHALAHLVILVVGTGFVSVGISGLQNFPLGELLYFLGLAAGMISLGFLGGFVWGLYLLVVSFWRGDHPNDAFSAMRLDGYRHFIRMRVEKELLTIYPICVDKVPSRDGWQINPSYVEGNQNTPYFVPKVPIGQKLIEGPIQIDIKQIAPLRYILPSKEQEKISADLIAAVGFKLAIPVIFSILLLGGAYIDRIRNNIRVQQAQAFLVCRNCFGG